MSRPDRAPVNQRLLPAGAARDALRHTALTFLSGLNRTQTEQALATNRVQHLYLHFLPHGQEERFMGFIRELRSTHEFVSYSEAVNRSISGPLDRPLLAISFDDGFKSNLRAARLLAHEGISACFFLAPNLIGKDRTELEHAYEGAMGEEQGTLTWSEVHELLDLGHEVGSHTLDHPVLSETPLEEAVRQIRESKASLEAQCGPVLHFAWPRGQFHHFRPELVEEVRGAGYVSCASAVRGAHVSTVPAAELCVRREHWVTEWPKAHMKYLMARSLGDPRRLTGRWPDSWTEQGAVGGGASARG